MAKSKGTPNGSYRIVDDVMALAGSLLRSRKELGAEKLKSLAEATRAYAVSLTDLPTLRAHATTASESIESLSDYVMHTEIESMVADARNFAGRHPYAALGVTIAAGLVVSQLMRPVASDATSKPRRSTAKKKTKTMARSRRTVNGSAQAHA